MFIFIDESGQLNPNNAKSYFIIASFCVDNPRFTAKKFSAWKKSKFPKPVRGQAEVKFSDPVINNKLRLETLNFIAKLGIKVNFIYFNNNSIPKYFWIKEKLASGKLYTLAVSKLAQMFLPLAGQELRIFCDNRHLKNMTIGDFKFSLQNDIRPQLLPNSILQVEMVDSSTSPNIQIADWIAGALSKFLENKESGKDYLFALQDNLVKPGFELFKK